jgi:hypothetical protein
MTYDSTRPGNTAPTAAKRRPVPAKSRQGGLWMWAAAIVVLLVAAAIAVWAIAGGGSGTTRSSTQTVAEIQPVGLSAAGLLTLTRTLSHVHGQPIYWAGPEAHYLYELRRNTNGNVYIRYLPPKAKVGSPAPAYLAVATYPFTGAYAALQKVAGSNAISIPGGGIAFVDATDPKSVHLAFPNSNYQVEVYDPSPARARAVATSGRIRPVG